MNDNTLTLLQFSKLSDDEVCKIVRRETLKIIHDRTDGTSSIQDGLFGVLPQDVVERMMHLLDLFFVQGIQFGVDICSNREDA